MSDKRNYIVIVQARDWAGLGSGLVGVRILTANGTTQLPFTILTKVQFKYKPDLSGAESNCTQVK